MKRAFIRLVRVVSALFIGVFFLIGLAVTVDVAILLVKVKMPTLFSSGQHTEAGPAQSYDGVQEGLHTNETIRQVWDSQLNPSGDTVNTMIYWLDNSTLMFMADKDPKPTTLENNPAATWWLYLWRLGEKPHPLGEDASQGARFYRGALGNVCYQQIKTDPVTGKIVKVLMMGPPGQEREASPWKERVEGLPLNGVPEDIELIDCEQFADPKMAGRIYETDSYRHYYIDRAAYPLGLPPKVDEKPVLMKSDGSERKILPIPPEEVGEIYFRTFDNVFWILEAALGTALRGGRLINGYEKWKATNCLALWRIDPVSGSTDRKCIPFGPWSGEIIKGAHNFAPIITLAPTAKGLFFASSTYTDSIDPNHVGPSGLYKFENGTPHRILAGYINHATVSPNGCRVAFIYGPNWATHNWGTPGSWTIAAIDLCASDSQQHAD